MAEALDERDRRRAIWIWPSLFVLGFWVPLFVVLSDASPPGSLSRSHAVRALKVFFGYWAATLTGVALAVVIGHPFPAVVVAVFGTIIFVVLSIRGAVAAAGASTVGQELGRA